MEASFVRIRRGMLDCLYDLVFHWPVAKIAPFVALYPLLLICFAVAAVRAASWVPMIDLPLKVACSAVIGIQLAGVAVFMGNYLVYHISGEDDEAFLIRNVSEYNAVLAVRPHLGASDRVLVSNRQLVYHIDTPVFYANKMQQWQKLGEPPPSDTRSLRAWRRACLWPASTRA